MKAMILAAGRGERMGELTSNCPKPLLRVAGVTLLERLIEALRDAGFEDLVINHAWLGQHIVARLGDGSALRVRVRYAPEPPGALETGGGILAALPGLGAGPFLVVNGDVFTDYPFARLRAQAGHMAGADVAHLVLVPNPPEHAAGDFALRAGRAQSTGAQRFTFSGIGLYRAALFDGCTAGRFPLAPLLRRAMDANRVSAELYRGAWRDIGTPERLSALRRHLGDDSA